jgi:tRNA (cmo5U34)-methyltransferase
LNAKFFDDEVAQYDAIVSFTQEDYEQAHGVLSDLASALFEGRKLTVLSLGCGTGEELCRLSQKTKIARAVLVDSSIPMLEAARIRLEQQAAEIHLIAQEVDLRQKESFVRMIDGAQFDLVISAFSLHHLSVSEKREIYPVILQTMKRRAYFLNLDLFKHGAERIQSISRNRSIAWLDKPRQQNAYWDAVEIKRWRRHILHENNPLTLDPPNKHRRLDDSSAEIDLLRAAGFREISVPYRYFETGILVASR